MRGDGNLITAVSGFLIITMVSIFFIHLKIKISKWIVIFILSLCNILFLFTENSGHLNYKDPIFYCGLVNIALIVLIIEFPQIYKKIRNVRNELLSISLQRPLIEKIIMLQDELGTVEKRVGDLETSKEHLSNIYDSLREIIGVLKEEELMGLAEDIFVRKVGLPNFILFCKNGEKFVVQKEFMINTDMKRYMYYLEKGNNSVEQILAKTQTPHTIQIKDEWNFQNEFKQTNLKLCIFFPFLSGQEILGGLVTFIEKDIIISDIIIDNATIASKQFAMGLKKVNLYKKVEELSIYDGLTKLYLHRVFKKRLEEEIIRANRYGLHLSFLMLDIDYFKTINDNFGHITGDMVLERIGSIIKKIASSPMIAARYGGEEFAIICPNYNNTEAMNLAEKIRNLIEKTDFTIEEIKKKINLTISIGISYNNQKPTDANNMIRRADNALYAVKNRGRNSVELAT